MSNLDPIKLGSDQDHCLCTKNIKDPDFPLTYYRAVSKNSCMPCQVHALSKCSFCIFNFVTCIASQNKNVN